MDCKGSYFSGASQYFRSILNLLFDSKLQSESKHLYFAYKLKLLIS